MPKAYLRGLTQQEERREGADFFANLPGDIRIFAFQFKAPRGPIDGLLRISRQSCHRLHGKAATRFTRKLPPITRQSCHPQGGGS